MVGIVGNVNWLVALLFPLYWAGCGIRRNCLGNPGWKGKALAGTHNRHACRNDHLPGCYLEQNRSE